MSLDDDLDRTIGEWLARKELEPSLLPGAFARTLPAELAEPFLRELEALATIDGLTTNRPPRDLPLRYGDFRVLGELGRGAMGAVYDAEQISTGRRVALKVLHAHVARDLHSASRFQREARTAAALVHPGIVPVLGFGETDGASWLAMARIDGRSLQRLLAAADDARDVDHDRAIALLGEPRRLARTLADAADALEFAHRHGVVHRDVKPANLMVGDDDRVVVLDFGLATARDDNAPSLTRTGDFLGTPLYMAPEQAIGAENGTAASDVYALGAVLYECLSGRPPVQPGPLAAVIDRILNRDPIDPRSSRVGVPDELARIALQCLEKEPRHRYATAAALADDLRRFVDGVAVQARGHGAVSRSLRRLRRRPALASLLAAVLVLVPLVVLAIVYAERRDTVAMTLQVREDLQRMQDLLARAPEGITVFGGASLRYYARLGLGEQLPATTASRSPLATQALELGEDLLRREPGNAAVLRGVARALLDVGDDPMRTEAVLARLLAADDARPGDRAMAAVWQQKQDRPEQAAALRAGLPENDPEVAFWLGFRHQDEQDHGAAIAAFTRALDAADLDQQARYFALLHRGWCSSCPDVCRLREAQDDLLKADALRPRYGTAKLLWAALHVLEPDADIPRAVKAVGEVLRDGEPWLHVLTARVLQALAAGGTWQSGPVHFGAEFSPIAVLPIDPARAGALAGIAQQLLDGVLKTTPDAFEAQLQQITGLALLGKHTEAIELANDLQRTSPPQRVPLLALQRARVHLAAGRSQKALTEVNDALARDPQFMLAWRFAADLAAHVGDSNRELMAVERAIESLAATRHEAAVFADASPALPELQLRRARILDRLGRQPEAIDVLVQGNFGGPRHGASSPRIRQQKDRLLAQLTGIATATNTANPANTNGGTASDSPLRWLPTPAQPLSPSLAVASAGWRGWLPATASDVPAMPGLEAVWQARGSAVPKAPESAPLTTLLPNVPALLRDAKLAPSLLARADALLAQDPDHAEARLLRAVVLFVTKRNEDAARFLAATLDDFPNDLRARYLLATAAMAADDRQLLRLALRSPDGPTSGLLSAAELNGARAALHLPAGAGGDELLSAAR